MRKQTTQVHLFHALGSGNEIQARLWLEALIRKNKKLAAQYIEAGHSIARLSGQILVELYKEGNK
jgi:hypothetical protein